MRSVILAAFMLALVGCGASHHNSTAAPVIPNGSHVASAPRDKVATVDTTKVGSSYQVSFTPQGSTVTSTATLPYQEKTLSDDGLHTFFLTYGEDGRIYLLVDSDWYLFGWGG